MQAGRLRHRVTLQVPEHTQDSDGADVCEWSDAFAAALPAEISPLSGRELIAAATVHSKVTTRIVLRYRPAIAAEMRVVHRSTVYDILAVVPDTESGNEWLTLLCASGVNQG